MRGGDAQRDDSIVPRNSLARSLARSRSLLLSLARSRSLSLPTFRHLLIVNKTSLSLSLSPFGECDGSWWQQGIRSWWQRAASVHMQSCVYTQHHTYIYMRGSESATEPSLG